LSQRHAQLPVKETVTAAPAASEINSEEMELVEVHA